jgi:hypothetical protein
MPSHSSSSSKPMLFGLPTKLNRRLCNTAAGDGHGRRRNGLWAALLELWSEPAWVPLPQLRGASLTRWRAMPHKSAPPSHDSLVCTAEFGRPRPGGA